MFSTRPHHPSSSIFSMFLSTIHKSHKPRDLLPPITHPTCITYHFQMCHRKAFSFSHLISRGFPLSPTSRVLVVLAVFRVEIRAWRRRCLGLRLHIVQSLYIHPLCFGRDAFYPTLRLEKGASMMIVVITFVFYCEWSVSSKNHNCHFGPEALVLLGAAICPIR